jgi:hypothetical protein
MLTTEVKKVLNAKAAMIVDFFMISIKFFVGGMNIFIC